MKPGTVLFRYFVPFGPKKTSDLPEALPAAGLKCNYSNPVW